MTKKKGRARGKAARNAKATESGDNKEEQFSKSPHSFVFHRGHVGKAVKELVGDTRKIMEPYTASRLKVRKKNVMKDFLTLAGPMHVSHFIVFTKTDIASYMKLVCVPRGPTLTFKITEYSLSRDVLSFQKHPDVESKLFNNHAVMVTNIPQDTMENKLMNVTFKNMFPSINPNTVKLNNMRRAVLVNYDKDTKNIELRHYTMKVVPTGISRAMKKLMKPKLPNMGLHNDIADVFLAGGMSDSEGEQEGPHSQVTVSQKIKDRGVARNQTNAIRLKEIGPRLNLQLIKIEEGFEGGNVLYHSLVQKTPDELEALKQIKIVKKKEKLARKQRQEANVQKKTLAKEEQVRKTVEGMKKKKEADDQKEADDKKEADDQKEAAEEEKEETEDDETDEDEVEDTTAKKDDSDSEDDFDYYKKEVGQDPEPEMFSHTKKRKPDADGDDVSSKRARFSQRGGSSRGSSFRDNSRGRDSRGGSRGRDSRGRSPGGSFRGGSRDRDSRGGSRGGSFRGGSGGRDLRGGSRGRSSRGGSFRGGSRDRDSRGGSRGRSSRGGSFRGGSRDRDSRGGSRGGSFRGGSRGGSSRGGSFRGGSRGRDSKGRSTRGPSRGGPRGRGKR